MKTQKILLSVLMSIFLIASVSAAVASGNWEDSSQTISINSGDSVGFTAYFFSMSSPMTLSIELYSGSSLIYSFETDKVVSGSTFSGAYTITPSIYNTPGSFKLMLSVDDAGGYSDFHTLNLEVISPTIDTTAPVITILGNNPVSHQVGTTYTDAGATAWDNVNGDLTSSIITTSNVNANVIGTYTVTYDVTDTAGNTATATRTVNVVESTVITITSPQEDMEYGDEVTQLSFEISDSDYDACWYSLDGGDTRISVSGCGSSNTISGLESKEGTNTWIVYARNSLGYETSTSVTFIVDTDEDSNYNYRDPTEREYLEQFNPIVLPEIELEPETTTKGWFARLIEAIVNFFKALFGID